MLLGSEGSESKFCEIYHFLEPHQGLWPRAAGRSRGSERQMLNRGHFDAERGAKAVRLYNRTRNMNL